MNWKKCMPSRKDDSYVKSSIIFSEKYKNKITMSSAVQTGALMAYFMQDKRYCS